VTSILNLLIGGAAFMVGSQLLRGVEIKSFWQAVGTALVVVILDYTLGTFLKIITLGVFSLGIFTWLLNAILIQIANWFLPKFEVKNFWWALALAAVVSIASGILSFILA